MAEEKAQGSQGFWTSMPGMLAALAAVITAAGGVLTALKQSDKAVAATPERRVHKPAVLVAPSAPPGPVAKLEAAPPDSGEPVGKDSTPYGFDLVSVKPSVGSPLPVGRPVELVVSAHYRLAAAPQAVFGVYVEEFPPTDSTCSGNVHHTNVGKLVPVTAQSDAFQVTLKWQRKAGDTYKNGGPADRGFLSVGGNLWQDGRGRAGTLIHAFGNSPAVCIPYG